MARTPAAVLAVVASALLFVAIACLTLSARGRPTELEYHATHLDDVLSSEPAVYYRGIDDFDLARPTAHDFDYTRPDFAEGLMHSLNIGRAGFSSYGGSSYSGYMDKATPQSLAQLVPVVPVQASAMPVAYEEVPAATLLRDPIDKRDKMSNTQRSNAAHCYGVMHACLNWMAVETGRYHVVAYDSGAWCTDDTLTSSECYEGFENDKKLTDDVIDVPAEGKEFPTELWHFVKSNCPLMDGCPKPKAFSTIEDTSVYKTSPEMLKVIKDFAAMKQTQQVQCCVVKQQALLNRLRMYRQFP